MTAPGSTVQRAALALLIPLFCAACPKNGPPAQPQIRVSSTTRSAERARPIPTAFNGERAMDHARKQVEFGPRPPGSRQLEQTRAYIVDQLKSSGLTVSLDEFIAKTPQGETKMANIIGELAGETKTLVLLASHYE